MRDNAELLPPFVAIGHRIRQLREANGISRRDLAERLNVDVSSLVGWEAGKRLPRAQLRAKLADVLGSDPVTLFATTAEEHEAPITVSLVDTMEQRRIRPLLTFR